MPIKIIGDYRELLIDIFFAIVIAVGLDRFLREFLLERFGELNSIDFGSISKVFFDHPMNSQTPFIFDFLFFFAIYFWVISHWVVYHELLTKYPYYRWRKFFVDIALFTIMFVIVNISFTVAENNVTTLLLVWLLILWYSLACLWHLFERDLHPIRRHLLLHMGRLITYILLVVLLYNSLLADQISYQHTVMIFVILALIFWNVDRLWRFLKIDSREYLCKYIKGYPRMNSSSKGRLKLVRYPIKDKISDKDFIEFKSDNLGEIKMIPKNIIKVDTDRISNEPHENIHEGDLILWINYNFSENGGNLKEIKVVFDLNDKIIATVKDAIEELCKRNKHGTSP